MISLRLSAGEYETLRSLYPSYGARNVSDFARLAMQRVIGSTCASDNLLVSKMREMDDRLRSVEIRVALLMGREGVTS